MRRQLKIDDSSSSDSSDEEEVVMSPNFRGPSRTPLERVSMRTLTDHLHDQDARLRNELAEKDREINDLEIESLAIKRQSDKYKKDCDKLKAELAKKQRESTNHALDASNWKGHYGRLHALWKQQNEQISGYRTETVQLANDLLESRFDCVRTRVEKAEIEQKLKESLKRKHDNQDKELLDENKRLRLSIAGNTPTQECAICMEHYELGKFIAFNPCGHMTCSSVC